MNRTVKPELLDELSPDDPRAVRSRRDLRRVNAWMRNHTTMAKSLQSNWHRSGVSAERRQSSPIEKNGFLPKAATQITELGAGDGHFLLRVAQNLSRHWPNVKATLLDRQKTVSAETLAAFAETGWHAQAVVADVFDWWGEAPGEPAREDARPAGMVVVANLFLHHFEDARLADLLRKISERASLFVAIEPHRFAFPFLCGQLLWLIGCNAVTRHDAAISVRAGFLGNELSSVWPDKQHWRLTEQRAGLFSHLFIARRVSGLECADMSALSKAATCRRSPQ